MVAHPLFLRRHDVGEHRGPVCTVITLRVVPAAASAVALESVSSTFVSVEFGRGLRELAERAHLHVQRSTRRCPRMESNHCRVIKSHLLDLRATRAARLVGRQGIEPCPRRLKVCRTALVLTSLTFFWPAFGGLGLGFEFHNFFLRPVRWNRTTRARPLLYRQLGLHALVERDVHGPKRRRPPLVSQGGLPMHSRALLIRPLPRPHLQIGRARAEGGITLVRLRETIGFDGRGNDRAHQRTRPPDRAMQSRG